MDKQNMEVIASNEHKIKAPWHLWLTGLFFIFIYSMGIYDYFMMLGHNVDYYSSKNYGKAVVEYFTNYPVIFLVFWTLNVFGGLISQILLLFRTRWAVWLAFVSAASMLCLEVLTFSFRNRWNVFGPSTSIFDIAVLLATCGFLFYCKTMAKRGVLR